MNELRLKYPVRMMRRIMNVSASGYYAWVDRPLSKRAQEEVRLELEIMAAHQRNRQTYGPERLQRDLAEHGVRVGVCRIRLIRQKLGIRCKQKRRFKTTTNSAHRLPVADNLLGQQFKVSQPNAVWVSDITYIPTDEGWLYLAGHKDLFTGELVGYAMGERMTRNLVSQSLFRALSPPFLIHRRFEHQLGEALHRAFSIDGAQHCFRVLFAEDVDGGNLASDVQQVLASRGQWVRVRFEQRHPTFLQGRQTELRYIALDRINRCARVQVGGIAVLVTVTSGVANSSEGDTVELRPQVICGQGTLSLWRGAWTMSVASRAPDAGIGNTGRRCVCSSRAPIFRTVYAKGIDRNWFASVYLP